MPLDGVIEKTPSKYSKEIGMLHVHSVSSPSPVKSPVKSEDPEELKLCEEVAGTESATATVEAGQSEGGVEGPEHSVAAATALHASPAASATASPAAPAPITTAAPAPPVRILPKPDFWDYTAPEVQILGIMFSLVVMLCSKKTLDFLGDSFLFWRGDAVYL